MPRDCCIVITDGSPESAVVAAVARQRYDIVLLDVADGEEPARQAIARQIEAVRPQQLHSASIAMDEEEPRLAFWSAAISHAAALARHHEARAIVLPLRTGPEDPLLARVAEFIQIWEDLLANALETPEVKLEAPLLDLSPHQVRDLARQLGAARTSGEQEAASPGSVK